MRQDEKLLFTPVAASHHCIRLSGHLAPHTTLHAAAQRGGDIIWWGTQCPKQHKALGWGGSPQSLDWSVGKEVVRAGGVLGTKTRGHLSLAACGENSGSHFLYGKIFTNFTLSCCIEFCNQCKKLLLLLQTITIMVFVFQPHLNEFSQSWTDNRQHQFLLCGQVSIRSSLSHTHNLWEGWDTASVIRWPKHLKNTNRPFSTLKLWTLLTNKGQYLPLSAPRPLDGSLIGGADQIKNSWPDVGVKWTGRCHQNGNLSAYSYTALCFVSPYWRITRGYKLLIITLHLWRINRELWPSGLLEKRSLFCIQTERFYYACSPSL